MTKYLFLSLLLFNLSWVSVLTVLHIVYDAVRHYLVVIECGLVGLLLYELLREWLIVQGHVEPAVTPLRTQLYAMEHVMLGFVLREAMLYYEKAYSRFTRTGRD